MSETPQVYEVPKEPVKKKAFLVVGVTVRDTTSTAKHIQAKEEFEAGGRWEHIREDQFIYEYIEKNHLHPLCATEWFAPIKNQIIVKLLSQTENVIKNDRINGLIISGQFLLDEEIRKDYTDILTEQGFEINIVPVDCDWMSVMRDGYDTGKNIKELYRLWKLFNDQFSRTYHSLPETPEAILIEGNALKEMDKGYDTLFSMFSAMPDRKYKIIVLANKGDKIPEAPFTPDVVFEYTDKIDTFWRHIAYNYNVKLVVETNATDTFHWHRLNVPVISLTNQFALEKTL